MAVGTAETRLAGLRGALRQEFEASPVVLVKRWLARAFALLLATLAYMLFSWLGLICALVVLIARTLSLSPAWIAFPAVLCLPVVGLLTGIDRHARSDQLAIVALFALIGATLVGIGSEVASRTPALLGAHARVGSWFDIRKLRPWLGYRLDYLVACACAGIAAQSWFESGRFIAFGDIFPFLSPTNLVQKAVPVWSNLTSGLGGRGSAIVTAPVASMAKVFEVLGVSGPNFERLFLTALFIGEAFAIIFLIKAVWPSARMTARLAGGLFYLFNLLGFFNLPGSVQMLAFLALPLLTGTMLSALETGSRRYIYGWAVATLTLGYVGANLPLMGITLVGSTLIASLVHYARGAKPGNAFRFFPRALPLALLLNAWWIVPAAITLLGSPNLANLPTSPEDWGWTHARNSIRNLFTLNAAWGWPQKIYFPYAPAFLNPIVSVVIYAPAALAFGALAAAPKRSRLVPSLAMVSLILIFVSKGIHSPFQNVNVRLLADVPGLWVLREPASKLLPLVTMIFALLITYSVNRAIEIVASNRYSMRFKWLDPAAGIVALGLLLPLVAWPILTGSIVADSRPVLPGTHIEVPNHWKEAAGYLNGMENQNGAMMLLPLSDYYQMPYEWGFYGTDQLAPQLFSRPVVVGANIGYIPPPEEVQAAVARLEGVIRDGDEPAIRWLTRALGVKYILLRADLDHSLARELGRKLVQPSRYKNSLLSTGLVSYERNFGPLTLFEVDDVDLGPVSAWTNVQVDPSGSATARSYREDEPTATVLSEGVAGASIGDVGGQQPSIDVSTIDGTRYVVDVRDARAPFILTLNQTYDSGWQLTSDSGTNRAQGPIRVNGFANGWVLSETGDYRIILEFEPETIARLARWISLFTITGLVLFLFVPRMLKRAHVV